MSHIELIGGVGAGKSAFAKCLAEFGYMHVPEEFESNPYLERFHKNPRSCVIEFGTTMLKMHAEQINAKSDPAQKQVFDFSLVTNEAYARTYKKFGMFWFKGGRGDDYIRACAETREAAVKPALRVYLDLSPDVQKARILERGRALEKGTPKIFLSALKKNLDKAVEAINDGVPLLVVDAAAYDWVKNPADKRQVALLVEKALGASRPALPRFGGPR